MERIYFPPNTFKTLKIIGPTKVATLFATFMAMPLAIDLLTGNPIKWIGSSLLGIGMGSLLMFSIHMYAEIAIGTLSSRSFVQMDVDTLETRIAKIQAKSSPVSIDETRR